MNDEIVVRLMKALISDDAEEKKKLLVELSGGVTWGKYLEFTQKEISSMPQKFRKLFRIGKLRAYIRERKRGKSVNYEVRCRMDGINVSAGGTTKEEARQRFIEKLKAVESGVKPTPTTFGEFIHFYFENFRKRKVSEKTYRCDLSRVNTHLIPAFGTMKIADITPAMCQAFLDKFGSTKTAEELCSLLSQTFKCAIAHHLIQFSPIDPILRPTHDRENGKAFTREEESFLLANAPKDAKESIAVILYTGLRPCEYKTLRREGDMLIAQNCKRKDGKIEYKRIPICPMLAPLISDSPALLSDRMISRRIAALLPGRSPYDLRTTFNTRCVECHVDDNARKLMMGHSLGVLGNAYTDVSDDFLREEAQKINYPLPPTEKFSPNSSPNA